jgi:CRP-like cAMP-binding protein
MDSAPIDHSPHAASSQLCNLRLAALPGAALGRLEQHMSHITLEPGQVLHSSDDAVRHVHFPSAGMIALMIAMPGGPSVAVGIAGRGDIVGASSGAASAVVMVEGAAWCISAADLATVAREAPAVRDMLLRDAEATLRHVQITAACNALHPIRSRMLRLVLQARNYTDDDTVPLTQEMIAELLGVRRSSVSALAVELKASRLIHYTRGVIRIVNRKRLEAAACDCFWAME